MLVQESRCVAAMPPLCSSQTNAVVLDLVHGDGGVKTLVVRRPFERAASRGAFFLRIEVRSVPLYVCFD